MVMVNARGQTRRLVIIRAQENMNAGSLLKKKVERQRFCKNMVLVFAMEQERVRITRRR